MNENYLKPLVLGAIATNCYILPLEGCALPDESPGRPPEDAPRPCAVIDPGADAGAIISLLENRCLYPAYILLTHGHFDHIGALGPLAARYNEEPIIAIHRSDAAKIGRNAYRSHKIDFDFMGIPDSESSGPMGNYMKILRQGLPEPAQLLEDGDRVGPFTVLHLPGHSPGSIAFYDEGQGLLFGGDVLFQGGIGRTDLPGGNWNDMAKSLKRLFTLNASTKVYPGHGPATTLAGERRQLGSL
jgi:glyoxylase-like metal-dependent hydrolase (beta-lactamase superfamily II)